VATHSTPARPPLPRPPHPLARAPQAAAPGAPAGEAWLYFGCRAPGEDYLYRDDLEAFAADGTLTQLRVAFSRAGAAKQYVQHLVAADAARLGPLLAAGARVYVCGDGARMAKDVHACLAGVLAQAGLAADEAAGAATLAEWARSGRYVRDLWAA